jgi:DNA repair exonuclease SbcCD ATPase subunit
MPCNCLENINEKTIQGLEKLHPDWTFIEHYENGLKNLGLDFGGGGWFLGFPFEVKYTFQKTNGETSQIKTHKVSLYGSHCPFCGKKHKEDEPKTESNERG